MMCESGTDWMEPFGHRAGDVTVNPTPKILHPNTTYSKVTTIRKIVRNRAPLVFDLEFATRKVRVPSARGMVPCFKLDG